jgi:hypothetical protein
MNSLAEKPVSFNKQSSPPQAYRSIAVSNVRAGEGDVIATCDVRCGGIFIRNVCVRRGRNNSTFVNYPSARDKHGHLVKLIEVTSPQLEEAIRQVVLAAAAEVTR